MTINKVTNYSELSCWCDPFPDELLYSLFARYKSRMRYSSESQAALDLFGNSQTAMSVSFPSHLDQLINRLPSGHQYTVDQLINKHTILPFYEPFLPQEKFKDILNGMKGSAGKARALTGISTISVPPSPFLYFCPQCFHEDKKRYGQKYWHRMHQIPGVEVCLIHHVFLERSNFKAQRQKLVPANEVIESNSTQFLDLSNRSHEVLLKVANEVDWLLNQSHDVFEPRDLGEKYLALLTEKDLFREGGGVRASQLQSSFLEFYPSDVLRLLRCHPDEDNNISWLGRIINDLRVNRHHYPIRHILLCLFLGYTMEIFFQVQPRPDEIIKPFGWGPWPCLDMTGNHYQQLVVEKCEIRNNHTTGKLLGKFTCQCGFSYLRKGPDFEQQDIYSFDYISSFSESYNNELTKLWNDSSISVRQIAKQLKIDRGTVTRQAYRLNLKYPRLTTHPKILEGNTEYLVRFKGNYDKFQADKELYRSQLLKLVQENPNLTRTQLRYKKRSVYDWLYKHDQEWLNVNLPFPRRELSQRGKDWDSLDEYLQEKVASASRDIINSPDKPVRVTRTQINLKLDFELTKDNLKRLPKTAKVLSEVTETNEDFIVRRICWSAQLFREEGICPSRTKLLTRVSLQNSTICPMTLRIQQAIDRALHLCASIDT